MLSYPFIQELFTAVLLESKAIKGNFHISSKNGSEINSDNFGEVIEDLVKRDEKPKYPLALMMPPTSESEYEKTGEWDRYMIDIFFLKTTGYNSENAVENPNPHTGTTTHTVPQDWHDMKRVAVSFCRVLRIIQSKTGSNLWRILGKGKKIIPVSFVGNDRCSGVRLLFPFEIFSGCELEDYILTDGTPTITLPSATDSHPEHKL